MEIGTAVKLRLLQENRRQIKMKKHEINLSFTETEQESISETCKCEFCGDRIRFYRHKRWIGGSGGDYIVQDVGGHHHSPCRPRGWSEFGAKDIPDGWEYHHSGNDDDRACFTRKKYSRFDR